jgi:sirohydrochlorin ferrochelatase
MRRCIALGADEIVVVPYFLSSGQHVTIDIPEQVAGVKSAFRK